MNEAGNWRGTLEMVRRAGTRRGRELSGYFSIEGFRLHERALRAGVPVVKAVITEDLHDSAEERPQILLQELRKQGCQIMTVPATAMEDLVGERDFGHIVGLIALPRQRELGEVLASSMQRAPLLLVAINIKDPGNVGAMIRTAHAGRAAAFVATGVSDPYHPKALRTTMGSIFRLPVLHRHDALALIDELRRLRIELVGTVATGGVPLPQAQFAATGTAVLIGSEAYGLADEVLAALDKLVTIPMGEDVDSYSVNAAAAILLYEIGRRRN